jgi:hypothetical protein
MSYEWEKYKNGNNKRDFYIIGSFGSSARVTMNFFLLVPEGPASDRVLGISVMTSSGADPTLMYSVECFGEMKIGFECLLRLRSDWTSCGGVDSRANLFEQNVN